MKGIASPLAVGPVISSGGGSRPNSPDLYGMTFAADSGYFKEYNSQTGKIFTFAGAVQLDAYATTASRRMWMATSISYVQGLWVSVFGDSHTLYPGKVLVQAYNYTDGYTLRLLSDVAINDGYAHHVAVTYNGSAGTAELVVDGINADDLGYASRLITTNPNQPTGTFAAFAGIQSGGVNDLRGKMSHLAYCDKHIDLYSLTDDGVPIDVNTTTWSPQFNGIQPQWYSTTGNLAANDGTSPNAGTIGTAPSGPS